jgi:hypothetical protein
MFNWIYNIFVKEEEEKKNLECMQEKYKKLDESALFHLLLIQEKYMNRFKWGLQGYSNVYVEIDIADKIMGEMLKCLPFTKLEDRYLLNKIKKAEHDKACYHEKYVMEMNLEETREFFSIFKKDVISPKMDKAYILDGDQPNFFHQLTDDEMEKVFPSWEDFDSEESNKVIQGFVERTGGNTDSEDEVFYRRIKLLLGKYEENIYCTKLVYFKNVHKITSMGILRFYFDYITYDDGTATNFSFGKNKKQKVNQTQEDTNELTEKNNKRKTMNPTLEEIQKEEIRKEKVRQAKEIIEGFRRRIANFTATKNPRKPKENDRKKNPKPTGNNKKTLKKNSNKK